MECNLKPNLTNKIYITKGDYQVERIKLDNQEQFLQYSDIVLTVREYVEGPIVFSKSAHLDEASDYVDIEILPEDTISLDYKEYCYDVKYTVDNKPYTIIKNSIFEVGVKISE